MFFLDVSPIIFVFIIGYYVVIPAIIIAVAVWLLVVL